MPPAKRIRTEQRYSGSIKLNKVKCGFIQQDDGEEDILLLPSQCSGFGGQLPPVGVRVSYSKGVDPQKGRPLAEDVHPEHDAQSQPSGNLFSQPQMMEGGCGGGKGMNSPSWKGGGRLGQGLFNTFKLDKSGGELGEFKGRIKSFNFKNWYGFIECPDLELAGFGDIFLHGDMIGDYQEGQTVMFTCVLNGKGKPNACDLYLPLD